MSRSAYVMMFTITNPTTTPIVQLATPAGCGLVITEMFIGQEAGETSEQVVLRAIRRSTASTLPTAAAINPLDVTAPATKLATTTTTNAYGIASATGTAGAVLQRWTFNALNGLLYVPVPEARIEMDISSFLTIEFPTAPAANIYSGYICFEES